MKQILTLSILISFFFLEGRSIYAQIPAIQWQNSLGGTETDEAKDIIATIDGGYIIAGGSASTDDDVTDNHGGWDFWIVKLSSVGIIEWQKNYGGSGDEIAFSIYQTLDTGYIVAGHTSSNDGDVSGHHGNTAEDFWIVKLDREGIIEWQKSLGGTGSDEAYSIQQCSDSSYIVAGITLSNDGDVTGNNGAIDCWIVKLTKVGEIDWQKCLGGTGEEWAYSIEQTNDGGFAFAGVSNSNDGNVSGNNGDSDFWVVKLSSNGIIQWQKSLGGNYADYGNSIQQTSDAGYIVAGGSKSDIAGHHGQVNVLDYLVIKLNSSGGIQWQKSFGGIGSDIAYSIKETVDGGFIIAGDSDSNDGDVSGNNGGVNDSWIVKLDNLGTIDWQKAFGGTSDDRPKKIIQTIDGGFAFTGKSNSNDVDVSGNHGNFDYWVVKLGDEISVSVNPSIDIPLINIYPNPVKSELAASGYSPVYLKLCDAVGQTVAESKSNKLYVGNLSQGLYVLQLFDVKGQQVKTEKVIVAK